MKNTLSIFRKILWIVAAGPLGIGTSEIITYLFPVTHVNSLAEASMSAALFRAIPPAIIVAYCISKALKNDQVKYKKNNINIKSIVLKLKQNKMIVLATFSLVTFYFLINSLSKLELPNIAAYKPPVSTYQKFLFEKKDEWKGRGFVKKTFSFEEAMEWEASSKILNDSNYINANKATREAIRKKHNIKLKNITMPDGQIIIDVPDFVDDRSVVREYYGL